MKLRLNISFRLKFLISSLFASLFVPLFCGWVLYKQDIKSTRELIRTNIESQISNFSRLIFPAIVFDDTETCFEQLEGFSTNPMVQKVVIWKKNSLDDRNYQFFTKYPFIDGEDNSVHSHNESFFNEELLSISKPIIANNENVGIITVVRTLDDLQNKKAQYLQVGISSLLCISLILVFITLWYQNSLIRPLKELSKVATTITRDKNYQKRAKKRSMDEFGKLTDAFNEMLDSIHYANTKLKLANEEMEIRVEKRTKELTLSNKRISEEMNEKELANIELIKTREKLSQREKLANVGQVSSTIAHELRNPMAAIRNSTYFLRLKLGQNEKLSEHLKIIDREITRSDEVIQSLLKITRGEDLKKSKTDLKSIAKEAMNYADIAKNTQLFIEFDPEPFELNLDKLLFRQVLYNLFLNSIQAMPKGGNVYLKISKGSNNLALISIKDEGTGIEELLLNKIFDPLYTDKNEGIGLGLSLCRDLVLRHGGTIEVESEINVGTTFNIKIPII